MVQYYKSLKRICILQKLDEVSYIDMPIRKSLLFMLFKRSIFFSHFCLMYQLLNKLYEKYPTRILD